MEVWRWGLLNYVVAGSLAADVMVPLQFSGCQESRLGTMVPYS